MYSQPTLASLTFVKGRLWSAPEAMRCEIGVFFAIFHFCMCPLGRQRARPSKAPQVEHICGIGGHWCQVIVFRRIGRLGNPSQRYYNVFVHFSRHFDVSLCQFCCFWPVMMSSGDRVSQCCVQVCFEGTYFGAQHILNPAENSSWAWHTVAAMLAIWDYPKFHGLTWRPCHSQNRRSWATPKRYVGHI